MFAFLHEDGPVYVDGWKQASLHQQFGMMLGIAIGMMVVTLWHGPVEPQQEVLFWYWDWMGIQFGSLCVIILTWWACVGIRNLIK